MGPRRYQLHQTRAAASCAAQNKAPSLRLAEGFWNEVRQVREEQGPQQKQSMRPAARAAA
jgi:hypothetical protein